MNTDANPVDRSIRFSRWVFLIAGTVGVFEIVPLYFSEATLNQTQPPPITHPEFYYGFIGVVLAWQVAFLIISRDPLRYRPLLPAVFLEKLLFPVGTYILFVQERVHSFAMLGAGALDLAWLVLFVIVWTRLRS